jgi:cell wall-associated NlpC family hydrolase
MIWKKPSCAILLFTAALVFFAAAAANTTAAYGQVYSRPRIVPPPPPTTTTTTTTNQTAPRTSQPTQTTVIQRPTLTNQIVVRSNPNQTPSQQLPQQQPQQLVKKTADVKPTLSPATAPILAPMLIYSPTMNQLMMQSIREKIGIRYVYGTEGPNSYDCSGFVWSVFQSAGIPFERGSAKTLWAYSVPVSEAEKYKFGTLVFFNKLGHVGIVADENGFYHASSSKGITYSKFAGYWGKRIVGFRRLPNTGF